LPSGDGNRIWFAEMIEMLRSRWNGSMTFPGLVELCARLDGALQQHSPIVGPRLPPGSRCPKCGRIVKGEDSGPYRISVRAAILALGRFGIASPGSTKILEKEWRNTGLRTDWTCTAVRQSWNNLQKMTTIAATVPTPYRIEQSGLLCRWRPPFEETIRIGHFSA
jgi:hypothetical protein